MKKRRNARNIKPNFTLSNFQNVVSGALSSTRNYFRRPLRKMRRDFWQIGSSRNQHVLEHKGKYLHDDNVLQYLSRRFSHRSYVDEIKLLISTLEYHVLLLSRLWKMPFSSHLRVFWGAGNLWDSICCVVWYLTTKCREILMPQNKGVTSEILQACRQQFCQAVCGL